MIPIIIILVIGLVVAIASLLISVPGIGGIWSVIVGIGFFIALLAGLVMVITLAGRWAMQAFGGAGLAVVLGISGMVDVDAAIIAMSRLPAGSLTPRIAGLILAAPILANTLVKAGLAFAIAKGSTGVRAATPLLVTFLAGLAGVVALAVVF